MAHSVRARVRGLAVAVVAGASTLGWLGCSPSRPTMCGDVTACAGRGACVAGRCQSDAGPPQVEQGTRYVSDPVDVACVDDDDTTAGALPASCTLGRPGGARLLLRFSVPLSDQAEVIEAYVLLHRVAERDPDPAPFSLHASRIVGDWNGSTVRAATLPPLSPTRSADTMVDRSDLIRVDVREVVKQWRRKDAADRGIVLESSGGHGTGMQVALVPGGSGVASPGAGGSGAVRGPVLELYVK